MSEPPIVNCEFLSQVSAASLDNFYCLIDANVIAPSLLRSLADHCLDAHELVSFTKRKQIRAQQEFIASRLLIKTLFSQAFNLPYEQLWLSFNQSTNRLTLCHQQRELPFHLSLAHSQGMVFIGVNALQQLGVDIEFISPNRDITELANEYFNTRDLDNLDIDRQWFYQQWTLKEAYAKMTGSSVWQVLQEDVLAKISDNQYISLCDQNFAMAIVGQTQLFCPSIMLIDINELLKDYIR